MRADVISELELDWPVRSLSDVCVRIGSGGTPSRKNPAFYEKGTWPWVKTQELRDGWLEDTEERITDEAVAKSSAKVLPANTILVAMYGATVGQLGLLRRSMTCNQACCALQVDSEQADFRYIYYQLLGHRAQLKSSATGAAQQNLSVGLFRGFRLPFPPLAEQQAIAETLGALDDKIDLNRKMNATLDELARTIFRSWFVDFDPVRAKAEGREPFGMDAETAALFPDRFVESELGPIPEGWTVDTLSTLMNVSKESVSPSKTPAELFSHYSLPAFDAGKMPITEAGGEIKSNKTKVPEGAVLLSKLNPRIPRVWLTLPEDEVPAIASTEFVVMLPSPRTNRAFLYSTVTSDSFFARLTSLVSGTSGSHQRVRPNDLLQINLSKPRKELMDAYSDAVSPMLELSVQNLLENRTLADLRDTLLPELISGRIRVSGAQFS